MSILVLVKAKAFRGGRWCLSPTRLSWGTEKVCAKAWVRSMLQSKVHIKVQSKVQSKVHTVQPGLWR